MRITINRDKELVEYKLPFKSTTLLKALYHIKSYLDPTLTFSSNCRSGVCGECAVRVNGKEVLACSHKIESSDIVEPLKYHKLQRDLKVDKTKAIDKLKISTSWLHQPKEIIITPKDVKITEKQSECILCSSCYSVCPVLEINPNFIGAFALSRAYRYTSDPRETQIKTIIDNVQTNGIWDCTLCGECTAVCPQGIDPKMDITMLRSQSTQFGYSDPNFMAMDFGFGGF
jgi:fumarate reductase iron-sulfur subunit